MDQNMKMVPRRMVVDLSGKLRGGSVDLRAKPMHVILQILVLEEKVLTYKGGHVFGGTNVEWYGFEGVSVQMGVGRSHLSGRLKETLRVKESEGTPLHLGMNTLLTAFN